MAPKKIVIIDDEEDILELVDYNLLKEGFKTFTAETAEDGLKLIKQESPDLIILDLMLPGMDGLECCRELKRDERYANIPIVMLTAKGDEVDIVTGLELGADDYITKPFSPKILIARIKTSLRKQTRDLEEERKVLTVHGVTIDPIHFKVKTDKKTVDLTQTEFDLLYFLAHSPGRVYTRTQIIDNVKGEYYPSTNRAVDVQIVGLRKKLGAAGRFIETVRGIGYRFRE